MKSLNAEAIALLASEKMVIEYYYVGVFNATTLRLWTGNTDISIDGQTFLGNGWLMNPGVWKETSNNQSFGQTITLTGVPLSMVSLVFNQISQANTGAIGVVLMNDNSQVVDTFDSFSGILDAVSIDEGPRTSTINLSYESKNIRMQEKRDLRLSDASHRVDYPDDKGFEYLAQIPSIRVYWGKPDTTRN